MRKPDTALSWLAFLALMCVPSFILVYRRMGNFCFYALLLLALLEALLRVRRPGLRFGEMAKRFWPLHLAMAGQLIAILVNQIARQDFVLKTYDYPSRMALFIVLLWVASQIPYRLLRHVQWAFVLGTMLATLKMVLITDFGRRRDYVDFMPIIEFAQLTLILGFSSILTLSFPHPAALPRTVGIVFKIMVGIGSIYAAYLSQTRGAWIGIPVFILVTILTLGRDRLHFSGQLKVFVGVCIALALIFGSTDIVRHRIEQGENDMAHYSDSTHLDTSVGTRLQLWKASWLLFTRHPLVGVGMHRFPVELGMLEHQGIITHYASIQPHSHNEVLYNMATLGSLGLLGILGLYFVPAWYFGREMRHEDPVVRGYAGMGLILCLGYFILGLVDVMLMWGVSDNFYAMLCALLFSCIMTRKRALDATKIETAELSAAAT